jgi:hypothetical protein
VVLGGQIIRGKLRDHPDRRKLMIDSKIFKNPMAAELTKKRIQARKKRTLTYDCMGAIVKGSAVVCKEGHRFPQVGRKGQTHG